MNWWIEALILNKDLGPRVVKLIERLDGHRNSIVVLSMSNYIDKSMIKPILDELLDYLDQGTLCVIGDCSFNTNDSDISSLLELSNRERTVLSNEYALSLLALRHDAHLTKHPSIAMGCVGHYGRYLTRHQHLDFPYGNLSIFEDLESLKAIYINIGNDDDLYAIRYAYSDSKSQIIRRNECVLDHKALSYLDFEIDVNEIKDQLDDLMIVDEEGIKLRGARYPKLIKDIKSKLDHA